MEMQAAAVPTAWGAPITWPGLQTAYAVYRQNFVYGATPFRITDMRTDDPYSDKESYETRSLTVYRAAGSSGLFENRPVVFFVHGGAWTDGYENWYDFVAQSFAGAKGWVTVVIDYRLTSDQVFIADPYCPDREHCDPAQRIKAAWYPDNAQDVAAAFEWVVEHIAANGGHPGQFFIFGHSAGGHLASLLSVHPSYASVRPAMRGVISMSGAYTLTNLSMLTFGNDIDQTFHGGHVNNNVELTEASPSAYLASGMELPPVYLLYAQMELPSLYEQTITYKNRLTALGLRVQSDYLAGYSHSSEMEAIADVNATPTARIVAFIEGVLAKLHNTSLPLMLR